MAVLFIDGFDKYGAPGSSNAAAMLIAEWTAATANTSIQDPLSSTGYSLSVTGNSGNTVTKTLPGSFTRIIGGVRFKSNLAGGLSGSGGGVSLLDSNFSQV